MRPNRTTQPYTRTVRTRCFDNQRRTRLGCSPYHRARHSARSIYHRHRLKHGVNDLVFLFFSFSLLFVSALPFPALLSSFLGSQCPRLLLILLCSPTTQVHQRERTGLLLLRSSPPPLPLLVSLIVIPPPMMTQCPTLNR
jgi:hypothetical protein